MATINWTSLTNCQIASTGRHLFLFHIQQVSFQLTVELGIQLLTNIINGIKCQTSKITIGSFLPGNGSLLKISFFLPYFVILFCNAVLKYMVSSWSFLSSFATTFKFIHEHTHTHTHISYARTKKSRSGIRAVYRWLHTSKHPIQ